MSEVKEPIELVKVKRRGDKINVSSPLSVKMKGSYLNAGKSILMNEEMTPSEKAEGILDLLNSMDYVMARMGVGIMKELEKHVDFNEWIGDQAKNSMIDELEERGLVSWDENVIVSKKLDKIFNEYKLSKNNQHVMKAVVRTLIRVLMMREQGLGAESYISELNMKELAMMGEALEVGLKEEYDVEE